MKKGQIFGWFFFAVFIVLLYLFFEIMRPFLWALFWSAILALILYPLHERLTGLLKNRAGVSSLIMTALTTLLIVVPLLLMVAVLAVEMFDVYREAQVKAEKIEMPEFAPIVERIKGVLPVSVIEAIENRFNTGDINPQEIVVKGIGILSAFVFEQVQSGARNVVVLIFNFSIMVFAMFFFFRDGRKHYLELKYLIPMTEEQKDRIFKQFYDILNAVFLGVMATAAAQGVLMGLIFVVLAVPFPVLAGALTFIFSLLPVAGALFVWLPVGIYLIIAGEVLKGVVVIVFGALVISSVDNFLKPMIIGGRTKLPTMFLLLTILGSVGLFGFSGIILGPVLLALLVSFIEIYKQEYREPAA